MVLFWVDDKDGKFYFFDKTFLLENISMNIVLRMPLLTWSNVEFNFNYKELR